MIKREDSELKIFAQNEGYIFHEGKWEEVEQGDEYSLGGLIDVYSSDSVFWVKR